MAELLLPLPSKEGKDRFWLVKVKNKDHTRHTHTFELYRVSSLFIIIKRRSALIVQFISQSLQHKNLKMTAYFCQIRMNCKISHVFPLCLTEFRANNLTSFQEESCEHILCFSFATLQKNISVSTSTRFKSFIPQSVESNKIKTYLIVRYIMKPLGLSVRKQKVNWDCLHFLFS